MNFITDHVLSHDILPSTMSPPQTPIPVPPKIIIKCPILNTVGSYVLNFPGVLNRVDFGYIIQTNQEF